MAWEVLAIWGIVIATTVWFFRDERRLRAEADLKQAARYYAHAPKYRHVSVEPAEAPAPAPQPRTGGLNREQRAFIAALTAPKASA
ncbi:hypothetical protein [Devosia sp. Root635]|uniref:hypothetical protein n=1 Tax=Devosia sp. Root635 TaxID=1736575 RepID=UPI0006F7FC44|nr:hypothetical protein [Devosia sp. Root635]KRA47638.1 hypothetical protein ASD80_02200 [Devosia sp. Root635]